MKVSITTTHKEGLVVGMRSMPGNPYAELWLLCVFILAALFNHKIAADLMT
ncbi:hypothetical protein OKW43_004010 [Paraburkholderia sp. WC7.3g]